MKEVMHRYKENVDYVLVPDDPYENKLFDAIKILREPYVGVFVRIGMLKFADVENKDGAMPLKYDFEIITSAGLDKEALEEDRTFTRFLGDVLISILEDQLGEKEPDAREFPVRDADPEDVED